ncbi:chemotaxis protein CheD [Konateibacter massiliensis]|uniref:chemotaxis protein CheD n=1 Tax=Konateibacter massiliensis TaxID=2002841 RepID=UPI0015D4CC43|nr:chemotaxis protein CheD [Konateibacter massiliensis]
MEKVVGIGEYIISNRKEDFISTYALSSCVAVVAYCPLKSVAGMLHIALPYPPKEEGRIERPGYYATTGLPAMLHQMCYEYGCKKEELIISIYGGADSIYEDVFKIGEKNVEVVKLILKDLHLSYAVEETRGYISRTLHLNVEEGKVLVTTQPIKI